MVQELKWLEFKPSSPPLIIMRSSIIYGLEDGAPVVDTHTILFVDPVTGQVVGKITDVDGIAPSPQADGCGY